MEINAKVYAVAEQKELLQQIEKYLNNKLRLGWYPVQALEPCAVLPLTKTWFGFTVESGMTDGPEGWISCLRRCAAVLKGKGAVVVEFSSPDSPDEYLEYAYTTPDEEAESGDQPVLTGYRCYPGNDDITLAIKELFSGRNALERERISRRRERRDAVRKEKGDFEITSDGILKKYRGHDLHVVIPEGVREIGESAFTDLRGVERMLMEEEDYDAPEMKTLTIPESVEKIGTYAFAYCLNLESVTMADNVKTMGNRAFEGCQSLKEIHLSAGLSRIEEYTFFLCEGLETIEIPEGITHIEKAAFMDCWFLSSVTLPESLISIGDEAFSGSAIKKIRIPENTAEISANAFPKETVKEIQNHRNP